MTGRSDASTSTDELKNRPLCLFYFTHPFGVLSPEPPLVSAAPPLVARAFLDMQPVPWPPAPPAPPAPAPAGAGPRPAYETHATVHRSPLSVVSVACTRRCTLDLTSPGSLSSSLFSSDVWFSPVSSRGAEPSRRLIPYNRILPPLKLPSPRDSSALDGSDDLWPKKYVTPGKFSLPPIEMPTPVATVTIVPSERMSAVQDGCASSSEGRGRAGRDCRRLGVRKRVRDRRADVRRVLARLMRRPVRGMGYVLDNCPTLHQCCMSVPLRVGVMVIGLLGLVWAAGFLFLFTGPGRDVLQQAGLPKDALQVLKYVFGIYGVLLCAVHVLLLVAAALESDSLCEVYVWAMLGAWAAVLAAGVAVAVLAVLANKVPFACLFLALMFLSVLVSFYFLIVVANYRMTLP